MTTLFHVSDIHFGLEDRLALNWFRQCVDRERPDAIAITGDHTMRARTHEWAAAVEWIRQLDAPVTIEVGNHDLSYFNPIERFVFPYHKFRQIAGLVEREIDLAHIVLISLKTTARAQWRWNWSRGHVSPAALTETLEAVRAVPAGKKIFVCCHHPLVEVGTHGQALTKNGEAALTELADAGVHAVLSGHVHDAFDLIHPTEKGPIRMIGAGTLSHRVRTTPPSFNEIRIDADRVEVIVRNLEHRKTEKMQIEDVPADAEPPHEPSDPVAPVAAQS